MAFLNENDARGRNEGNRRGSRSKTILTPGPDEPASCGLRSLRMFAPRLDQRLSPGHAEPGIFLIPHSSVCLIDTIARVCVCVFLSPHQQQQQRQRQRPQSVAPCV